MDSLPGRSEDEGVTVSEEFVVELLVVVEADSRTDAAVLGERAAKEAAKATTPRSAGKAKVLNVIVVEVRGEND